MTFYSKTFAGEVPPVVIDKNTYSDSSDYQEIKLISWRDIILKHLPSNANLSTVQCELKLEYLHFDYLIPSRALVPSDKIPVYARRESDLSKQVKTINFKNVYNHNSNYAFEFRLIKHYDIDYALGDVYFTNDIPYNEELGYPIADLIYNNRLPGFIDLMPYLTKTTPLVFGDIKQELKLQIYPKLSTDDLILVGGGYSGSVTFELLPRELLITKSENVVINNIPKQLLPINPKRLSFYLCNNGATDIIYNFGLTTGENSAKLKLSPGKTLVYEDKTLIIDNQEIDTGDSRATMNLPLWSRCEVGSNVVAIEEVSYV
ncbi:hypothetical protein PL11201_490077 [Planktothrix sp. PCC 11201]|uniref:hypothetical protein n=1 Tax=Planktothrix sp. PCC 11201 TaxID=1729650 RepID=UPI000917E0FF|nr:hypothetical protein [Planktothrix sp. PCC 11201]SKB11191.1 hypothetical protein PL11201_110009 [Planktothrix sp. PCC 11201]SKB13342.1 hypothetical protein PL11201_490077 [Planktothrix sp. PCC 11201]